MRGKSLIAAMLAAMRAGMAFDLGDTGVPTSAPWRGATRSRRKAGKTAGSYGRGLRAHFDRKREQAQREKFPQRPTDVFGAFTLVGRPRRPWVGGVSAQRGF